MRKKLAEFRKSQLPLCRYYEPYNDFLKTKGQYTRLSFSKAPFIYLERMKKTAASYKILYMTANQTYSRDSLFIIKKDFKDHKWVHQSYNSPDTYRGYINPKIDKLSGDQIQVWERCMSFPYIECKVKRFQQVKASYVDEKRQNITEEMFGFKSFVYQHCMDHNNGKCPMDWDVSNGYFRLYPESQTMFPKTAFVLKDYSFRVRQALQKKKKNSQNQEFTMTEEQKNFQKRQEQALRKCFNQELQIYSQKYN